MGQKKLMRVTQQPSVRVELLEGKGGNESIVIARHGHSRLDEEEEREENRSSKKTGSQDREKLAWLTRQSIMLAVLLARLPFKRGTSNH